MRGMRAKILRKEIYGEELSPRVRTYQRKKGSYSVIADPLRRAYQSLKRSWVNGR